MCRRRLAIASRPKWRNWQTQQTQNLPGVISWGIESPSAPEHSFPGTCEDSCMDDRPKLDSVLETILYVDDLAAARSFYEDVLGLEPHGMQSELGIGYRLRWQMLLLFVPQLSSEPGRLVPSHGASGPGHVAFSASPIEIEAWKQHLDSHGIPIEQDHSWPNGARSIYFRDPAGNSLEFTSPALWGLEEG